MPTEVIFGAGSVSSLRDATQCYRRPVVICGRQSARATGALDAVLRQVPHATVLEGVPENPETSFCDRTAGQCREARFDAIIGLGGGSALDAAKAIALLAANGGRCDDYFSLPTAVAPPLPVFAVPTTAGTGSEVTPYAVLVDPVTRTKKTLKHPGIFPALAVLDPALTVSLPPSVTIATALDALSQGMEGYVSIRSTSPSDLLALEVCRRVRMALQAALDDPGNLAARGELLYAAMLSGVVIAQTGTTLVHGMGYYYTLEYGIAHGAANALLLPPVFQYNARHLPEKVAALANALGVRAEAEPDAAGNAISDALYNFYAEIGFPRAARDHGVPEEAAARFASSIIQDPYRFKNQVGILVEEDVSRLFTAAWRGERVPF